MRARGTSLAEAIIATHPAAYGEGGRTAIGGDVDLEQPGDSAGYFRKLTDLKCRKYLGVLHDLYRMRRRGRRQVAENCNFLGINSMCPSARVI